MAICGSRGAPRIAVLVAVSLVLVAAGSAVTSRAAVAAAPSASGEIAYVRNDDIWIMNADGSDQRALVTSPFAEGEPFWSPDGESLFFSRTVAGPSDSVASNDERLWRYDLDTGAEQRVPLSPKPDSSEPLDGAVSPDGTRLALVASGPRVDELSVYDLATGRLDWGQRTLRTTLGQWGAWEEGPAWSPDGTKLAFAGSGADARDAICVVNAATGALEQAFPSSTGDYDLAWSSLGKLAFGWGAEPYTGVSTIDTGTGRVTRVARGIEPGFDWLSWSSDGAHLAVERDYLSQHNRHDIWTMDPENPGTAAEIAHIGSSPAWRPLVAPGARPSSRSAQASCYGADYDPLDTTPIANKAAHDLRTTGFAPALALNASVDQAISRLPSDGVFFFSGHGAWDTIEFQSPDGRQSYLRTSDSWTWRLLPSVALGATPLDRLDLAILDACDCGHDVTKPGNILGSFVADGAHCAIGFTDEVQQRASLVWTTYFFDYACAQHYEVGAAAAKAAADTQSTSLFYWGGQGGISPDTVVVERASPNETVYIDHCPPLVLTNGLPSY